MRGRRDLLRSMVLLVAFAEACSPIIKRRRTREADPPSGRSVIPAGHEAEVLALLGPLASQPVAGFKLERAIVGEEQVEYSFAGAPGRVVVTLAAIAVDGGAARAYTHSFRVMESGDAPAEARHAVVDAVAAAVRERDRGQLWVRAEDAPRSDGGR